MDATAAIGLSKGGVFELLPVLFSAVCLPSPVRSEVVGRGLAGEAEVLAALGDWLWEATPGAASLQPFAALASPADRAVLALAQERGLNYILTDDRKLQSAAERAGLSWLSTPDVVLALKRIGAVPAVKAVLDRMIANGFGIDAADYAAALAAAGE